MLSEDFVSFIRQYYQRPQEEIHLIETPIFGHEHKYMKECLDSQQVSTVGPLVEQFEQQLAEYVNSPYAVATVNGTSALHLSLVALGVQANDWVITQPFTFVATANAIRYTGAHPLFLDIEADTLGLSPEKLADFLQQEAVVDDHGQCLHRQTRRRIAACMPVHTFGHPVKIDQIVVLCEEYNIPVVEDAAEGLGSTYRGRSVGTFGKMGVFSFNGNKLITCGGGGALVTHDRALAERARHLSTQAKVQHTYDAVGFNYRMPNLNAALGLAQWEKLPFMLSEKRALAQTYDYFLEQRAPLMMEPTLAHSNYWLNAILLSSSTERDTFVQQTNQQKVYTRPAWTLLPTLPMFASQHHGNLDYAMFVEKHLATLPSSIRHA